MYLGKAVQWLYWLYDCIPLLVAQGFTFSWRVSTKFLSGRSAACWIWRGSRIINRVKRLWQTRHKNHSSKRRGCSFTSWIMPMNSENAQLSWFRTLLTKDAAMSLSTFSSSAMCFCSSNDGQGSEGEEGREQVNNGSKALDTSLFRTNKLQVAKCCQYWSVSSILSWDNCSTCIHAINRATILLPLGTLAIIIFSALTLGEKWRQRHNMFADGEVVSQQSLRHSDWHQRGKCEAATQKKLTLETSNGQIPCQTCKQEAQTVR